jgi:hypothetical protein
MISNVEYEWMAMSQWFAEHPGKDPAEHGWEFEWGALRRRKNYEEYNAVHNKRQKYREKKMAIKTDTINSEGCGGNPAKVVSESFDNN